MRSSAIAMLVAATVATVVLTSVSAQSFIGPSCPASAANQFCCSGTFIGGVCQCWSVQTFGPNCNFNCRTDLCNNHGVCDANSNPTVDAQGNVVSGVCVCDPSGYWFGDRCTANNITSTCTDLVKNGQETDVDCGGPDCPTCGGGRDCTADTDCQSGNCDNGKCTDPSCHDGVKNGQETDVDCGGSSCPKCTDGKTCQVNSDCLSGQCDNGQCRADIVPPDWTAPQPRATTTEKTVNVLLQINEPGTVYVVLLPDNAPAPTTAEVVAGTASGGAAALHAAAVAMPSPTTVYTYQFPVTLAPNTNYDIYLLPADDKSPPNFAMANTKINVRTNSSDVFPPEFWLLYSHVTAVRDTSADFVTALNEPGTVYYVIIDAAAAVPSSVAVKAASVANHASGSIAVAAAWTSMPVTVTGLTINTQYKAVFTAEDSLGNLLPNVLTPIMFTTTADDTAPLFIAPTPQIAGETDMGFQVKVKLNEPGWVYIIVVPQFGATPPTSLNVVQGVDGNGTAALAHTAARISTANVDQWITIGDLADATTYTVYVVAADNNINVQVSPTMLSATTLTDTTPPAFSAGYPTITDVTSHAARFNVQLNEPGVCYAVAVPSGTTAPTPAQVRAGYAPTATSAASIATAQSATPYFGVLTGLSPSTNYTAYVMCDDDSSPANAMSTVVSIDFSTPTDTFPPNFVPPSPSVITITDVTVTMEVVLDDTGSVFYVIVPRGATAPTTAEVLAGTASGGAAAISADSFTVGTVLQKTSHTAAGLTKLTAYDLYLCTRDAFGNSLNPTLLQFTTTDNQDNDAPLYRPTYPLLHTITTSSAKLAVRLDEPGQLFFVVTPRNDSAAAVSASQIIGATNQHGTAPVTSGSMVITAASVTFEDDITSLQPDTQYTVWVVARDNVQPPNVGEVVPMHFTTLAEGSCSDNQQNQGETDVDCGGPSCPKCGNGDNCGSDADCASGVCASNGKCVATTCENGVKDAGEADIDCGGSCPLKCSNGKTCSAATDCASGNCDNGICQPASCTPCAGDEITITACTNAIDAVCKVQAPFINETLATASNTVVTIEPTTSGSYVVATRNCNTPSCSMTSGDTTFDDAGIVKTIQTTPGTTATFSLFDSSIIRAVSCKNGVQESDVVTSVVKVNGGNVKVFASTTLYIRAYADFVNDATRKANFRQAVATVATLNVNDIAIESIAANAASPNDSTDVVYSVAIPSNNVADTLASCTSVTTVLNNIEGNGNLRTELLALGVVTNGGGNNGGNNGAGQETNNTPDAFDFTGGVAWLWWLIPLILLLLLCCLCCLCWLRRKEREQYHRQGDDSFRGDVVPRHNQISPAPSVTSAISSSRAMESDAMVAVGPAVRHTGNARQVDDDVDGFVGAAAGAGAGGYIDDDDDDDDAEPMMDLTAAVQKGEAITDTIETKGDTVFAAGVGGTTQAVLPGTSSQAGSIGGLSRPGSAYDPNGRAVGVDDLNALNIRALSFTRNAPGNSSYHSLSRADTGLSSQGSVSSGLRIWAGNQ